MKTTCSNLLLAAGAVAQLVSAQPHNHNHRRGTVTDEVIVTDIVTVTEIITIGGGTAYITAGGAAAKSAAHSSLHHQWHSHHSSQTSGAATANSASYSAYSYGSASSSAAASSASASGAPASSAPASSAPASSAPAGSVPASSASASGAPASSAPTYSAPASSAPASSASASSAPASSAPTYSAPASSASASSAPATSAPATSAPATSAAPSSSAAAGGNNPPKLSSVISCTSSGYQASTCSASAPAATVNTGLKGYSNIKAGLSGYDTVQNTPGFCDLAPYIGWYSDYMPNTPDANGVQGMPMLWGADGSACTDVTPSRLADFNSYVSGNTPKMMFGFYEPDCDCSMSSQMSSDDALTQWNSLIKPLGAAGATLGSPSMCTQKDETWLQNFTGVADGMSLADGTSTADWDVTSIHINVNTLDAAIADVSHYVALYGKPVWVSEFACVDSGEYIFEPCTDQTEINNFINDVVDYFQKNESVIAYGASNGEGLGDTWPLFSECGQLSETGLTYLNAISKYT